MMDKASARADGMSDDSGSMVFSRECCFHNAPFSSFYTHALLKQPPPTQKSCRDPYKLGTMIKLYNIKKWRCAISITLHFQP